MFVIPRGPRLFNNSALIDAVLIVTVTDIYNFSTLVMLFCDLINVGLYSNVMTSGYQIENIPEFLQKMPWKTQESLTHFQTILGMLTICVMNHIGITI